MSIGVCKYFSCIVSKQTGRDCSEDASLDCQTKKFMDRYGIDYLSMGCGSPMIAPNRIVTKALVDKLYREDMRDY